MESKLIIGTRGSKLALWQAYYTQKLLKDIGVESELKIIKTQGDKIQHLTFDKLEGKGFFTKEIEDCLLRGDIHLAVHSMKDLPTNSPKGLCITAVSYRANPADTLVIRKDSVEQRILKVKEGGVVGTSSARRKSQILDFRPDLEIRDIRGNVPTRLRKLQEGNFDAILLAAAGLERLEMDLSPFEIIHMNPKEFVPAPAQGVLAFQTQENDLSTRRILKKLHNANVSACTNVERKVLNLLDGGCQMPLGVYCERDESGYYHVWAAKADAWDKKPKRISLSSGTFHELAETVVNKLKA
jgi:hydroxymethylbilane synthase